MLNKFVIPVVLASVVVIAGIFAYLPIDKATTVHLTLPSNSSFGSTFDTQDRFVFWQINFTNMPKQKITLIPAQSGTITGFAVLTAEPNTNGKATEGRFACGLSTTNSERLGINASFGNTTSLALSSVLSAGEGIVLEAVNGTNTIPGVCSVTLIIDSSVGG